MVPRDVDAVFYLYEAVEDPARIFPTVNEIPEGDEAVCFIAEVGSLGIGSISELYKNDVGWLRRRKELKI